MSTSITIRNVPDETHDELCARAALAGQSLQEYLLQEMIRLASKPDVAALMASVHARKQAMGTHLDTETILKYRDADRK